MSSPETLSSNLTFEEYVKSANYLDSINVYTAFELADYQPSWDVNRWEEKYHELLGSGISSEYVGTALSFYPELADYNARYLLNYADVEWINNFCNAAVVLAQNDHATFAKLLVKDYDAKFDNLASFGSRAYQEHLDNPHLDIPKLVSELPEYFVIDSPELQTKCLENMTMVQSFRNVDADITVLKHSQFVTLAKRIEILDPTQPDYQDALKYAYTRLIEMPGRIAARHLRLRFHELDENMRILITKVPVKLRSATAGARINALYEVLGGDTELTAHLIESFPAYIKGKPGVQELIDKGYITDEESEVLHQKVKECTKKQRVDDKAQAMHKKKNAAFRHQLRYGNSEAHYNLKQTTYLILEEGVGFDDESIESLIIKNPEILDLSESTLRARVRSLCEVVGNQKATLMIADTPQYLTVLTSALTEITTYLTVHECSQLQQLLKN